MSQVLTHCPHLAPLPIYTFLSFSVYISLCSGKLLWSTQITLPPLLLLYTWKQLINSSLVISCQCYWSFPSSLFSLLQWNQSASNFPISHSPLSLGARWCSVQNGSFWHTPFSCLKTITDDIPSPCSYHAESRSHKLGLKVIKRTRRLLSAWVIALTITQQFNCQSVSP